ncbi:MAG: universal stress protein [Lysobacterales bacterium]|jgi:universal stress protein E
MMRSDHDKSPIRRVLVLLHPDDALPAQPGQSEVLQRATWLARATGCKLELFYPCHDPSLELKLFSNREEVSREKERVANEAATHMAELALHLQRQKIEVDHEVRWDHPEPDAILRKIADSSPDIVMKQSRGPNFVLGLSDNTDWELLRRSPAHLWFVKPGNPSLDTVITAIGGGTADEGIVSESDYDLFDFSGAVARSLGAENLPVHTYQVPRLYAYTAYAPMVPGVGGLSNPAEAWQEIAEVHGREIKKFARKYDIDPAKIRLSRGHPAEVLPELASSLGAGLIFMGARNLNRWERVFRSVSAEPVLAEAPCDVLFFKDNEDADVPTAEERPRPATPDVDLEMAITHPEKAFRTPRAVVEAGHLTRAMRRRILDAWERDIQAQQSEEDEGGPVRPTQAGVLKEISSARDALARSAQRE